MWLLSLPETQNPEKPSAISEDIAFGPMGNFLFPVTGRALRGETVMSLFMLVRQPTSTAGLHNAYKCEKKKRIQKTPLASFFMSIDILAQLWES